MARGKKTGGRKAGTPNKASAARQAEIAKSGKTPLDFLIGTMHNRKKPYEMRMDAAAKAAPYVHPKLATTLVVQARDIKPEDLTELEIARRISFALTRAGRIIQAENAPPPTPPLALPAPLVVREVDRRGEASAPAPKVDHHAIGQAYADRVDRDRADMLESGRVFDGKGQIVKCTDGTKRLVPDHFDAAEQGGVFVRARQFSVIKGKG